MIPTATSPRPGGWRYPARTCEALSGQASDTGSVSRGSQKVPRCIPDDDALHADLTSCGYKYDSRGRLVLESKIDMKKRGMPSPDSADAMALTFSEPEGSPIPRSIATNFNRKIEYAATGIA